MKKISIAVICIIVSAINVQAQISIIGKWKLVKFVSPESGEIPIDSNQIKDLLYKERVTLKKDTALVQADSIEVEELSRNLYFQFNNTLIEYKTNKTYNGTFGGATTTGTYVYNAVKKTITTKPKNKPSKTAAVNFENGQLIFNDKKEKLTMYFVKIK